MSAWIVDEAHIDVLIDCALQFGAEYPGSTFSYYHEGERHAVITSRTETGAMLLTENIRSVGYRYQDSADTHNLWPNLPGPMPNPDPDEYRYRPTGRTFSAGEAFKALGCFEYQSCETPDWAESEAHAFCEAAREAIQARLYDGPWGYSAEDLGRVLA